MCTFGGRLARIDEQDGEKSVAVPVPVTNSTFQVFYLRWVGDAWTQEWRPSPL